MYYFIPAWFKNNERPFYNVAKPWYRDSKKIEFDDSINQIKMFEQAGTAVKLLIIGYMPNLRSFLQRQELMRPHILVSLMNYRGSACRGHGGSW